MNDRHTRYYVVADGKVIGEVNDSYYVVPLFDMDPRPEDYELLDAADRPGLSVIPLKETLEWSDDEMEEDVLGRLSLYFDELADMQTDATARVTFREASRIANSFEK